jgi:hypothetical protein
MVVIDEFRDNKVKGHMVIERTIKASEHYTIEKEKVRLSGTSYFSMDVIYNEGKYYFTPTDLSQPTFQIALTDENNISYEWSGGESPAQGINFTFDPNHTEHQELRLLYTDRNVEIDLSLNPNTGIFLGTMKMWGGSVDINCEGVSEGSILEVIIYVCLEPESVG